MVVAVVVTVQEGEVWCRGMLAKGLKGSCTGFGLIFPPQLSDSRPAIGSDYRCVEGSIRGGFVIVVGRGRGTW